MNFAFGLGNRGGHSFSFDNVSDSAWKEQEYADLASKSGCGHFFAKIARERANQRSQQQRKRTKQNDYGKRSASSAGETSNHQKNTPKAKRVETADILYAEDARSRDSTNWIAWRDIVVCAQDDAEDTLSPIFQIDIPWPLAGDDDPLALKLPCKTADGGKPSKILLLFFVSAAYDVPPLKKIILLF